jgi:hypothetical protein
MFQRAQKKRVKLRMSFAGVSGSGKTFSALTIAKGLGGKIALIDTEAGRGDLYADKFEYDTCQINAPFTPKKYIECIKQAEKSGYDILIIDSLSHAWVGEGGVLSIVEQNGGTFQGGWRKATPEHNALVEAIIQSKIHIIVTMRSKAEYVVELNEKGKQAPRKVGMAAVQRDGLDYEMICAVDMNLDHLAHFTKDNTELFDQQFLKPTVQMGEQIKNWLESGIDEREDFIKNKLNFIIDRMKSAKTRDELKTEYVSVYKLYAEKFPEEFNKIIAAKDLRVSELTPKVADSVDPNEDIAA